MKRDTVAGTMLIVCAVLAGAVIGTAIAAAVYGVDKLSLPFSGSRDPLTKGQRAILDRLTLPPPYEQQMKARKELYDSLPVFERGTHDVELYEAYHLARSMLTCTVVDESFCLGMQIGYYARKGERKRASSSTP